MGSSKSKVENNCIEELSNVDENSLDISNVDKLQIKALKEMNNRIKEMADKKSDKIFFKLPAINICAPSLI